MSLTTLVAKATRRIHTHAVRLHTKALRARVNAAERATERASESARIAEAIAVESRKLVMEANKKFHKARLDHELIREAAETEANLIGGRL